jgi:serine/threonine-protein kinase
MSDKPANPDSTKRADQDPRSDEWLIPPAGTLFDGVYRIGQTIGVGGQGMVVRAVDEGLDRQVAIKFIRPDLLDDASVKRRFFREARAMARIDHPNVVKIFAMRDTHAAPFFVMEHIDGPNLFDYVTQRGGPPLAMDEIIGLMEQLCRGVQAIHDAGALHHDLKSTNILIGPAFRVAVTDFGLTRVMPTRTERHYPGGTVGYVAPEYLRRAEVPAELAPRADVYALGCILYDLIIGRPPFFSRDEKQVVEMQLHSDPIPPTEIRPELKKVFDGPVLRALTRDVLERTPSAIRLREELLSARNEAKLPTAMQQRVIVVDDDPAIHSWYERVIDEALPLSEIECFTDGQAALAAIEAETPDLVLTDLTMPGLDGFELTAQVKGTPASAEVPVIICTGRGGAPDWKRLQQLGANGFLVKPIDSESLVALVRKVVPSN